MVTPATAALGVEQRPGAEGIARAEQRAVVRVPPGEREVADKVLETAAAPAPAGRGHHLDLARRGRADFQSPGELGAVVEPAVPG